jgi:hypothetical protein
MIRTHTVPNIVSSGLVGRRDQDANFCNTLAVIGICLAVLAALFLSGCSSSSSAHAVDPPQARDALKVALEAWKNGENLKSLESSSTPMVVQDFDWAGGAKLVDFEIVGDGQPEDANLRILVKLTTEGGKSVGKPSATRSSEKKVWYLVTTSPKVTVFRDMLRR